MNNPTGPFTHNRGSHLRVGDADLYLEVHGERDKPPLLLLHGGLGHLLDLNPMARALAPHFRLVGLDARGHGRSTLGTAPLRYALAEADAWAVLHHLEIDRCAVLGFSDGGIVGYRLAVQQPDRVVALVTVGAQWRLTAADPVYDMLGGLTPAMWDGMSPDSRPYYESVNPAPDFDRLVQAVVALWTDLEPSGYPANRVKRIIAPTLLIRGDSDPLLSLPELVGLQALLPAASLFNVPFAGHEAHQDAAGLLTQTVSDFLLHPRHRDAA